MRAVPFGGLAASKYEGGWHAEEGMRCSRCGSKHSLVHVDGQLRCYPHCEMVGDWTTAQRQTTKPRRSPKQPWEQSW